MKARDIVGKRIKAVHQTKFPTNSGPAWHIDRILFDDGSSLVFVVGEMDGDYAVEGLFVKATPGVFNDG